VVPVGRLSQSEQLLQQPMQAGRPEQILAPHHLGHALQGVVDGHREVIAGRGLLAREDDVAPGLRPGADRAGLPTRTFAHARSSRVRRRGRTRPPYRAAARREHPIPAAARARRTTATAPSRDSAAPRRDRAARGHAPPAAPPIGRSRRGSRNSDRPAPGRQLFERGAIIGEMFGLPPHRMFPDDAEPGEVLVNRGLEFRLAARRVDILDAQQEASAGLTRQIEIQQRRISVAEMQIAVRARRKTEDRRH
jgi:hypothetical protein